MRTITVSIIIFFCTACTQSGFDRSGEKKDQEGSSNDTVFDTEVLFVENVDASGKARIDTIYRKIPKVRKIFRKGIRYQYQANYYDDSGSLITSGKISLIPTGQRIGFAPDMQDLLLIEYESSEVEKAKILNEHERINKTYPLEENWLVKSGEGVIENVERVWMHPIRNNQYIFTEINGFPCVEFPLEIGKKWNSQLSVNQGWGDWNGLEIETAYHITKQENLTLRFGALATWVVEVETRSSLGTASSVFYFNEEFGFVKMLYRNFKGEQLLFEMVGAEEDDPEKSCN